MLSWKGAVLEVGVRGIWATINTVMFPAMKRPWLSGDAVSNHFQLPELHCNLTVQND